MLTPEVRKLKVLPVDTCFSWSPSRDPSTKIHSVASDHANLRTNKERSSVAIFPQSEKNRAALFEAGVVRINWQVFKDINTVDLMGKKVSSSFTPAEESWVFSALIHLPNDA